MTVFLFHTHTYNFIKHRTIFCINDKYAYIFIHDGINNIDGFNPKEDVKIGKGRIFYV